MLQTFNIKPDTPYLLSTRIHLALVLPRSRPVPAHSLRLGRLVVAVALLRLLIVARGVAAALAPRPEASDVPVSQRLRGSERRAKDGPPGRARLLPVAAATFKFRGSGSRVCFMAA